MTEGYWVCIYCGTMSLPVVLQRSPAAPRQTGDSSVVAAPVDLDRADEHASDCPLYVPTVQPRRV